MATDTEVRQKPRNDAYTGLLAISFLALVGATVFIYLDAEQIGKPPGKLQIDVPGVNPGKAGDPLLRPDAGKVKVDAPMPMPMPMEKEGMSKAEPGKLPTLPDLDTGGTIVPVKGESRAEPDGPPLPVKPFLPPK
jgi:hypothetical protein